MENEKNNKTELTLDPTLVEDYTNNYSAYETENDNNSTYEIQSLPTEYNKLLDMIPSIAEESYEKDPFEKEEPVQEKSVLDELFDAGKAIGYGIWDAGNLIKDKEQAMFAEDRGITDFWDNIFYEGAKQLTAMGVGFFGGAKAGGITGGAIGSAFGPGGAVAGTGIGATSGGISGAIGAGTVLGYKEIYASEYDKALSMGFSSDTAENLAAINTLEQLPVETIGEALTAFFIAKPAKAFGKGVSNVPIIRNLLNSKAAKYVGGKLSILDKSKTLAALKEYGITGLETGVSETVENDLQQLISNLNLNAKAGERIVSPTEDMWESTKGAFITGAVIGSGGRYLNTKTQNRLSVDLTKKAEKIQDKQITQEVTNTIDKIKNEITQNYIITDENNNEVNINNLDTKDNNSHTFTVKSKSTINGKPIEFTFTGDNQTFKEEIINPVFDKKISKKSIPNNLQLETSDGEVVDWGITKEGNYQIRNTETDKIIKDNLTFDDVQQVKYENDLKYRVKEFYNNQQREAARQQFESVAVDEYLNKPKDSIKEKGIIVESEKVVPKELEDKGIRVIKDEKEADKIQEQFNEGLSEPDTKVKDYLLNNNGVVYEDNGNYLIGNIKDGVFIVNNYSPKLTNSLTETINNLSDKGIKSVVAVSPTQSQQLISLKNNFIGQIPQNIDGNIYLKNLYATKNVNITDINNIYKQMFDTRSVEDVNNILKRAKEISNQEETSDILFRKDNSDQENDSTITESASTVMGKGVSGKVTKSVNNELKNAEVDDNQSEQDKKDIRKNSNQGVEKFDDMKGAGDKDKYQSPPNQFDDTNTDPRIVLPSDTIEESSKQTIQDIEEFVNWRQVRLDDNIIFLEGVKKGLISSAHLKQAMINLCAEANLSIYFDLESQGISGQKVKNAEGATSPKNNLIVVKSSATPIGVMHEFAHNIYNAVLNKMISDGKVDAKKLINDLFNVIDSDLNISSYKDNELPGEMFAEIVAKYGTDPLKVSQLRKNSSYNNVIKAIDSVLDDLNIRDKFQQVQQLSERINNQSPTNTALANIIMRDLPYSRMNYVSNDVYSPTKFGKLKFKTKQTVAKGLHKLYKSIDDRYALTKKLLKLSEYNNISYLGLIDKLAFDRTNVIDTANAFIFGSGMTFSRSSISGLKNLSDIRSDLDRKLNEEYEKLNDKTIDKQEFRQDGYRRFYLYLQVMNTLGENLGTQETLNLIQDKFVNITDTKSFGKLAKDFWIMNKLHFFDDILSNTTHNELSLVNRVKKLNKDLPNFTTKDAVNLYNKYKSKLENFLPAEIYALKNTVTPTNTGITILNAFTIYEDIVNNSPLADTYATLAQDFYTLQDHVLNYMEQASSTTKHMVNTIRDSSGAFHSPLLRTFLDYEKDVNKFVIGDTYQAYERKGSDKPIKDIFKSAAEQIRVEIQKANIFSSLESLANIVNESGSASIIRQVANPEMVINVPLQDQFISLFKEIKNQIQEDSDLTKQQKEELIKYINTRLNGTYQENLEISNKYTEALNNYIFALNKISDLNIESMIYSDLSKTLTRTNNMFSIIDESGNIKTYMMSSKDLLDGVLGAIQSDPAAASKLKLINSVQQWLMNGVRASYLTTNVGYLLIKNSSRDLLKELLTSATYRGRAITPQQLYEVFTTYMGSYFQALFPKIFKSNITVDTLGKFGVQYSTMVSSLSDMEKLNRVKGELIPRGGLFAVFYNLQQLEERLGNIGRVTELKLLLKKDNLTVDVFDVTKHNLQQLTGFTKNTLHRAGITDDILQDVLTEEQYTKYLKYKDNKPINDIILLPEQKTKLASYIPDTITVEDVIGNDTTTKYARYLREATIDFTRGSYASRKLNNYVLFFNSSVNGLVEYGRFAKRDPKRAILASIDLLFLGMLKEMLGFGTDEDPDDDYLNGVMQFKFPSGTIWKVSIDPEIGWIQRLGSYLYKGDPVVVGKFLKQVLLTNTIGLFKNVKGIPDILASVVPGLFGANGFDISNMRNIHSPFKWSKFKDSPEKLVNKNTSTLALLLNDIPGFGSISPEMFDHIIRNILGYASIAGKSVDTGLALLSKFGDNKELYNFIRVRLNPNVPLDYSKDTLGSFLGITREETYTGTESALRALSNMYQNAYDDAKDSKNITNVEKENLHQRYLITRYMTNLADIYNKIIPLAQDEEARQRLINEKNKMIKETYDYVKNEGILYSPYIKTNIYNRLKSLKNSQKSYEKVKKEQLKERSFGEQAAKTIGGMLDLISSEANAQELIQDNPDTKIISQHETTDADSDYTLVESNGNMGPAHIQPKTLLQLIKEDVAENRKDSFAYELFPDIKYHRSDDDKWLLDVSSKEGGFNFKATDKTLKPTNKEKFRDTYKKNITPETYMKFINKMKTNSGININSKFTGRERQLLETDLINSIVRSGSNAVKEGLSDLSNETNYDKFVEKTYAFNKKQHPKEQRNEYQYVFMKLAKILNEEYGLGDEYSQLFSNMINNSDDPTNPFRRPVQDISITPENEKLWNNRYNYKYRYKTHQELKDDLENNLDEFITALLGEGV